MEAELAAHLISLGTAYGQAKNLGLATIGRLCAADGRFFSRIDDGKTFTVKKYDEVVAWFDTNWPQEVAWPAGITRPEHAEAQS